jgi:hypothetical protein
MLSGDILVFGMFYDGKSSESTRVLGERDKDMGSRSFLGGKGKLQEQSQELVMF